MSVFLCVCLLFGSLVCECFCECDSVLACVRACVRVCVFLMCY